MNALWIVVAGLGLLGVLYACLLRPWHLHWGATPEEVAQKLPGDELVQKPHFNATRGITIQASPSIIWRWILQIGSRRAGWYSIDWIDNAGIKSATEILPQFQQIQPGQFIPFTPNQKWGMWVKAFKENHYILWEDREGKASWLWYLLPRPQGGCRLLTRLRTRYSWRGFWIIYYLIFDVGDIIMMSRCMQGIKIRAEREVNFGYFARNIQKLLQHNHFPSAEKS